MINLKNCQGEALVEEGLGFIVEPIGIDFEAGGLLSILISHAQNFKIEYDIPSEEELRKSISSDIVIKEIMESRRSYLRRAPKEHKIVTFDFRLNVEEGCAVWGMIDHPNEILLKIEKYIEKSRYPELLEFSTMELLDQILRNLIYLSVFREAVNARFKRIYVRFPLLGRAHDLSDGREDQFGLVLIPVCE